MAAEPSQDVRYFQLAKQQPPAPDESDYFVNYDGDGRNNSATRRDWPIGLIFHGNASIDKVKAAYDDSTANFHRSGSVMYLGYKDRNTRRRRFDGDRGKKPDCDSRGRNEHFRIYGNHDSFYSRDYGYFVVASAHYDHGDDPVGPGAPDCRGRRYFGWSENVEQILVDFAHYQFGWSVRRNHLPLGNYEEARWAEDQGAHYWKNNGRASTVRVP